MDVLLLLPGAFSIALPNGTKIPCPFKVFLFGILRSVSVLLKVQALQAGFVVEQRHEYCGPYSARDLQTIAYDYLTISFNSKKS